jgi:LysR family transcriptional regulator for metE and metH
MDVDTRTLELLEAIAADGTLTAASRRLHISQPALSQRLSGLEARLGIPLFEREGRRLVPTRAGRRMITTSTSVLADLRAAQRDLDDLRDGRSGIIRFSSQCSTNYQWLPPVVQAFSGQWPDVELRIQPASDDDVIGALLADQLDIALASKTDRRLEAVMTRPLFDDELVAIVAADHPWAGRDHLRTRDFDGVNLIVFDVYDPARTPALPLPIPPGARPAKVTTTPVVSELVVELAVAHQGVGVLPSWVAAPYEASGRVATVHMSRTPQTRNWFCAWRKGETPPHLTAFVDQLATHFART